VPAMVVQDPSPPVEVRSTLMQTRARHRLLLISPAPLLATSNTLCCTGRPSRPSRGFKARLQRHRTRCKPRFIAAPVPQGAPRSVQICGVLLADARQFASRSSAARSSQLSSSQLSSAQLAAQQLSSAQLTRLAARSSAARSSPAQQLAARSLPAVQLTAHSSSAQAAAGRFLPLLRPRASALPRLASAGAVGGSTPLGPESRVNDSHTTSLPASRPFML